MSIFYGEDREYAVELHDRVAVVLDGVTYDGFVRRIHPRSREVTVRYEDWQDVARTTGNSRWKTRRLPLASVDLIGRDG